MILLVLAYNTYSQKIIIESPRRKLVGIFGTNENNHFYYTVDFKEKPVILKSPIGIILDSTDFGENIQTGMIITFKYAENYTVYGSHAKSDMTSKDKLQLELFVDGGLATRMQKIRRPHQGYN
jgi:hypothetical protein